MYRDPVPGRPVWLDTVGLDESDAVASNRELVRQLLRLLQQSQAEWLHAVIWCIAPEQKKLQLLKDQAEVIRQLGERAPSVWGNLIILARSDRPDRHTQNFQVGGLIAKCRNF